MGFTDAAAGGSLSSPNGPPHNNRNTLCALYTSKCGPTSPLYGHLFLIVSHWSLLPIGLRSWLSSSGKKYRVGHQRLDSISLLHHLKTWPHTLYIVVKGTWLAAIWQQQQRNRENRSNAEATTAILFKALYFLAVQWCCFGDSSSSSGYSTAAGFPRKRKRANGLCTKSASLP